jgi:hypothetical protein
LSKEVYRLTFTEEKSSKGEDKRKDESINSTVKVGAKEAVKNLYLLLNCSLIIP